MTMTEIPTEAAPTGRPRDDDFTYTTESGASLTVPSATKLDPSMDSIEAYEAEPEKLSTLMAMIRTSVSPEAADAMKRMKVTEFRDFIQKWSAHSGVALGESLLS
jgi:hypothetical protein